MTRTVRTLLALGCVALVSAAPLYADIRKEEKTKLKMGGALGKMMGMFMGRQAREGLITKTIIKGDRKLAQTGDTGQIIDLVEEKVYELDFKKKIYTVATFEEIRQKMREAQEKMKQEQAKMQAEQQKHPEQKMPEYEVEVTNKQTGEAREINGFPTKQLITTVTMHEKGKPLEDGGGMVLTTDAWLTPKIPGMKEATDFEMRYMKKLQGDVTAEEMAAALTLYPMLKDMMKRVKVEGDKVDGTPILTTMTIESVMSPEQMKQQESAQADSGSGGGGGLTGMFARKMMSKKKADQPEGGDAPAKGHAPVMTVVAEVLSASTEVGANETAIPEGFKQK